jgi:prepilin-type N-terminal cleavage/methylation domain-containing protein
MNEPTFTRTPQARVGNRGYTIVELMMAIAVFAIGVSGIIAMQKVAAAANQHSRSLSLATNIGQTWQDQLNIDSSLYTRTRGVNNTVWLLQLPVGTNQAGWLRPPWNANLGIGGAFDALGRPLDDTTSDLAKVQFCVHLRLTRLYPASVGIDVIRTEVRVIWPRTEGTMSVSFCDTNANVQSLAANSSNYHSLYQVSAVRQQP